jgi:hypothetical protein
VVEDKEVWREEEGGLVGMCLWAMFWRAGKLEGHEKVVGDCVCACSVCKWARGGSSRRGGVAGMGRGTEYDGAFWRLGVPEIYARRERAQQQQ